LNLTRTMADVWKPVDQRHREGKRRDIAPYRDDPKPVSGKISFAGADPYENEEW